MANDPGLVVLFFIAGLVIMTLFGGLAIMLACWLYNLIFPAPPALVASFAQPAQNPLYPETRFQVTQAGPYASPTSGYEGGTTGVVAAGSDVPMPSFLYSLAISFISWFASFIAYFITAMVCMFVLMAVMGGPGRMAGPPEPLLIGSVLILPVTAAMYCTFSGVLSLMLPTTYPRALLLALFSGIAFLVTYFGVCLVLGFIMGIAGVLMRGGR